MVDEGVNLIVTSFAFLFSKASQKNVKYFSWNIFIQYLETDKDQ